MPLDEDEVLFLTSNIRLYNAFMKWYKHYSPRSPSNHQDALVKSRELSRYLEVPTEEEILEYRRRRDAARNDA